MHALGGTCALCHLPGLARGQEVRSSSNRQNDGLPIAPGLQRRAVCSRTSHSILLASRRQWHPVHASAGTPGVAESDLGTSTERREAWRIQQMKEVLKLESELQETLKNVRGVRSRCVRLRDALERLEDAAMRSVFRKKGASSGRQPGNRLSSGQNPGYEVDAPEWGEKEASMAPRVLRGLQQSEQRLAILQSLAASLTKTIGAKERSIALSLIDSRKGHSFTAEPEHPAPPKTPKNRASPEFSAPTVEAPGQAWMAAGKRDDRTQGTQKRRQPNEQREGGGIGDARGVRSKKDEASEKAGERRRVVLALYSQEVQELREEVRRKVDLMEMLGSGGTSAEDQKRLEDARKLLGRLEMLQASIYKRIVP